MPIPITRAEYEKKFGVKPNVPTVSTPIESKPITPLLTKESGGLGTALKDVGTGFIKSLGESAIGTAQLFQSAGKGALGLAGVDTSQMGFKSLDESTPEGIGVSETLRAKSRGEQVGKTLGFVAEIGTGFVTSGAQQALKTRQATKLAQKNEKYVLNLVSPKATTDVSELAIKQGRVSEPKFFRSAKILPSTQDKKIAESVKDLVSSKRTVLQNTDAIDKGVRQINQGVKEYIFQNKVPFNMSQLKSQLNAGKEELRLIFASDKTAERTYNAVVDEFMKYVQRGDTAGLFEARQAVDKIPTIKKLLSSQGLGENVKKEVVLTIREMANRYVADLLPQGNNFRELLLKESHMIRAIENIAEKNAKMIGKNNLQILALRYPILKWVIGGIATGIAGSAGIGVGSAIIGSTD